MAVPPGEGYDSYEKLILPFDAATWFWLMFTFGFVFATIFIVRLNKTVEHFVIGRFVSTPVLNVVRVFFGVSQIQTPGRNFARYVLMTIILFSLVIRTGYQGVMFELLQKEVRKPTVASIEEMIEQNFTFHMPLHYKFFFNKSEFVQM